MFVVIIVIVVCIIEYDNCVQRILSCSSFPGVDPSTNDEERTINISSIIPIDSVNMVSVWVWFVGVV